MIDQTGDSIVPGDDRGDGLAHAAEFLQLTERNENLLGGYISPHQCDSNALRITEAVALHVVD